jgi:hypothetical protein
MIVEEKQRIACFSYKFGKSFTLIAGELVKMTRGAVTSEEERADGSHGAPVLAG